MTHYYVIPTAAFDGAWVFECADLENAKHDALHNHSPCVIVEKIGEFIHEQPTKVWKDKDEF
jgi:hypothetical protein